MTDNINEENKYQEDELEEEVEEVEVKTKKPRKARKKHMTRKTKRDILIVGLVAIVALLALYYFNNHQAAKNKDFQTSEVIDENSYTGSNIMRVDLNQVNKINIDLKTADVRIQKSTTNPYIEYTHLYKGEEDIYTVDVSYENGVLNLKSNIQGKELNMKNKIQIVRIFLPNDKPIEEIKAKIGAGDVKITDLEVKDLDLNVKSGHITFDNSFFGGFVTNEAGDIILTNTELMNTKLATNAGDISIEEGKIGARSDFSTQSGDIIIKSTDTIDNYNIKANLEVGNFILGNVSYRNIKNGFARDNKAKKEITLKTRVGDIIFNKGEGAILDEEEYITNKSNKEEKEESKYDYINVEDDEEATDEENVDDGSQTDTTDENIDEEQSEGEENNN
ncbi:DUF4097 family beta strand repeat-containing protein [Anaerococcus sp. Marseille-Q7828]|uniref:DUF4097 family beta strand repeat-containing protein n=1 Tax=Anaerococcus sp. Marseille-Q7828 TaxID=3036300 RepID=UPI0024ACC814|nr:DUF4097 family beta strand repeat-containing protein [Anaerococcus sp. Marseille-Q7828]